MCDVYEYWNHIHYIRNLHCSWAGDYSWHGLTPGPWHRRAGVGSTTFTLVQMTVAMLLWSSVMTWIYSCCWSTGHGAVIYRVISPSRWRSGTELSYNAICAYYAHSCFWAHAYHPPTATQCPTLSARAKRQRWKHWRSGLSWAIRNKIWSAAFHSNILNWTRFRWWEIIKFVGGRHDGLSNGAAWRLSYSATMNCSRLPETPPPPALRIAPESPLLQCFLGGECGGANTSSPAPLVTVSRLFSILVWTFYLSEGQTCHQTILSRLFTAAEILAVRCSCVAVPYNMLCFGGWTGSSTGLMLSLSTGSSRHPYGWLS